MATISSLLRSAQATQEKIQAQQDAQVAFAWDSSAQTYDDYLQYSKYLQDQSTKTTDPSKLLTYQIKQRSALTGFTNNEVQRQSQAVMEGRATTQDKMKSIEDLYTQAVTNGNYNLAQNLISTWDTLSVQLQNEQLAAQKAAGGGSGGSASQIATEFKNQVNDQVDALKGYLNDLNTLYQTHGTTDFNAGIKQYAEALGLNPNSGFFDVYANIANTIKDTYQQGIDQAPDAGTQRTFQNDFNKFIQTKSLELPSLNGDTIKVSLDDIQKQIAASQVGESLFTTKQTPTGTVFTQSKTDNYIWGRAADGSYHLLPNYSPTGQDLGTTPVDQTGNPLKLPKGKDSTQTYEDLLHNAGFDVQKSDGSFFVSGTNAAKLGIPGVQGDASVQVFIGPDGKLQVVNAQDQAYTINFDKTGKFTGVSRSQASAITPLAGTTDYARFNNPYYAANQDLIKSLPQGAVGIVDKNLAESRVLGNAIPLKGNFLGMSGGPVSQLGIPQFSPQAPPPVNIQPAAQVFTPVAPPQSSATQQLLSAPAHTQVRVVNLPPPPKLTVAKPAPVPQLRVKGSSGLSVGQGGTFNLQGFSSGNGIRLQ